MSSVDANADLCNLPAAVSPSGVYNFTNPESMKTTVYSVSCILTVIASLLTAGRVWVNRRKLSLADYTIVASMLLGIGFFVVILLQGRYYRHQWDVRACWMNGDYMKLVFLNTLFFGLCLGLGKVSILLLYLQLFAVQRPVRLAIYLALFFTVGLYITFIPCDAYFEAPHIGESWDDLVLNGRPNKAVPWSLAIGAGSILIDLYIFILPIPILLKLHTSTSKRMQILLLFGTALFGVAASIIAVVYRVPLLAPVNLLTPNIDNTWHVAQINIANLTECMVAISVACLPACVNLFRQSIGETNAWKSLRSAFTTRPTKYRSHDKASDIAEKPFARQGGTVWGPKQAQHHADTFELIGTDGRSWQTDMYVPPESYAGVAVNVDRGNNAPGYQDRVWITRTVDIYQQQQQQQQQKYGRSSNSIV